MQTPSLLARATQRRGLRVSVLALFVVTTLWGSVAIAPQSASAAAASTTTRLNLRAGPGTQYGVILVMPAGASLKITGSYNKGFYPVRYQGTKGWAAADYLTAGGGSSSGSDGGGSVSNSATGSATVTSSLNLRAGPSTGDAVLAVMGAGAVVTLTGQASNGFVSVNYQGTDGWAYESYLGAGGDASAPSVDSGPSGSAYTTTSVNLRSGAGTSYSVITVVPSGAAVSLTGSSSNGFYSASYNGSNGWLYASYVSTSGGGSGSGAGSGSGSGSGDNIPGGGAVGSATTTSGLNLRANSSTSARVIAVMPAGASVSILGDPENGFYPISYNGSNGWASGDFLSFGGGSGNGSGNAGGGDIVSIIYAAADA